MTDYAYRVVFESDWHIGSGSGRHGNIDLAVQRTESGLPFVPAKSVVGMLRDRAELAASALGPLWDPWIDWLFGEQPNQSESSSSPLPARAHLSLTAAHVEPTIASTVTADSRLVDACFTVRAGVAIDDAAGAAQKNNLRFVEVVRSDVPLVGCLTLPDDAPLEARTLLAVAAQLVDGVGGKRRRGFGRCSLTIDGLGAAEFVEERLADPSVPPLDPPGAMAVPFEASAGSQEWQCWVLTITTVSRVLAAESVQGNEWLSYDHIPGNLLVPLVAQIDRAAVARALGAGDLIVGPAYPATGGGGVPSPVPFALQRPKRGGTISNRFIVPATEQMKPVRTGHVTTTGTSVVYSGRGHQVVQMHNTINDPLQRPVTEEGGLFSYAAIPPGVTLRAEIRTKGSARDIDLGRVVGSHRIGRSRKDDYGQVDVSIEPLTAPVVAEIERIESFWVSLRSPAILLDENLRPDPTASRLLKAVASAVGDGVVLAWQDGRVATRTMRRSSWQSTWGLPRPTIVAVEAGSCGHVTVITGTVSPNALARVQLAGIGERRGEGYGMIEFNAPSLTSNVVEHQPFTETVPASPILDAASDPFVSALAVEAARRLIASAPLHKIRFEEGPSLTRSQVGALREAVLHSGTAGVRRWHTSATNNKARTETWGPTRLAQIQRLLDDPAPVWKHVDPANSVGPAIRSELQADAFAAVIAALCRNTQMEKSA